MSKLTSGTLTLRLPAPPLPPKPLHLTTKRNAEARNYRPIPSWSRPNSIVQPAEEVVISSEEDGGSEEEEEEEIWWGASTEVRIGEGRSQLYGLENTPIMPRESRYDMNGREGSESGRKGSRIGDSSSGSTLRRPAKVDAGRTNAARKSIFFDPTLPNPLDRNSNIVDKQNESLIPAHSDQSDTTIEPADDGDQLDVTESLLAVSLHAFAGETDFGELSFEGGTELRIEVEDLGGGWSLGYIVSQGEEGRGLIPRGFYAYVEVEESDEAADSTSQPVPIALPSPSLDPIPPPESPIHPAIVPSSALQPSVPTTTTSSILARARGRSIGASVVISGVEFEPVDSPTMNYPSIPSWLLPRPSSVDMTSQPPVSTPSPTKEEIKIFFDGFAGVNENREVQEKVDAEQDEVLQDVVLASTSDKEENVLLEPIEVETRMGVIEEVESGGGRVGAELPEGAVTEPGQEITNEEKCDEQDDEDKFDTFAPSAFATHSLSLAPAYPSVQLLRSRAVTSPLATLSRSFSLPGLYRLGMGTLGRSYSLTGIGKPDKEVEGPRAEGGVKRLVEDWILHGDESVKEEGETKYHIEEGPAWKASDSILVVQVHFPEQRPSIASTSAHTSYQISTSFYRTEEDNEAGSTPVISVDRRYSHFSLLYSLLISRYPVLSIDVLPSNAYAGRFKPQFIEARRRDLQRWLSGIVRHPVLSRSEELKGFLGMEEESDLRKLLLPSSKNTAHPLSTDFFSAVYHPEFNFDISEAEDVGQRFENHIRSCEEGKGFRDIEVGVQGIRESLRNLASTSKDLAHSIIRVVAGLATPLSSTTESTTPLTWKLHCDDALGITKAVQDTAEAIAEIAGLQEDSARTDLLSLQEAMRDLSFPHSKHSNLIELHKLIVAKNQELSTDEAAADRCETLLNLTLAEMERIHEERLQDLRRAAEDYLDSQIRLHDSVLSRLRFARSHFEESTLNELAQTGPRLSSPLERPPAPTKPLVHPSSYGLPRSAVASLHSARDLVAESVGSILRRRENQRTYAEIERVERSEPVEGVGTGFFGTRRMW